MILCVCPPEVTSPAAANGPIDMSHITYNSVSITTPWAVAGPHGQLASMKMIAMVSEDKNGIQTAENGRVLITLMKRLPFYPPIKYSPSGSTPFPQ